MKILHKDSLFTANFEGRGFKFIKVLGDFSTESQTVCSFPFLSPLHPLSSLLNRSVGRESIAE